MRMTGPRVKIIRRFGTPLPGLTRKAAKNRVNPPGQHGANHRRKASEYREHLDEKQKVRLNYGVSERQMRIYMKAAINSKIDTGLRLVQLLESRLDNFVFRAGYGATIPAARQLVNHGHILVNGRKVDIASFQVRPGDVISLREKSKKIAVVQESIATPSIARPSYIEFDANAQSAKMTALPVREDVPIADLRDNLIIEYYSRMV